MDRLSATAPRVGHLSATPDVTIPGPPMGGCDKPYTSSDKWTASALSGLTFLLISSPSSYSGSDYLVGRLAGSGSVNGGAMASSNGNPTIAGLVIHSLLYAAIVRVMMEKKSMSMCKTPYTSRDKTIASVMGGATFMVTSSPFFYSMVNSLTSKFGLETIQEDGTPNVQGLLLHTVIFTLITRVFMR